MPVCSIFEALRLNIHPLTQHRMGNDANQLQRSGTVDEQLEPTPM